jgi:hypothetical protein
MTYPAHPTKARYSYREARLARERARTREVFWRGVQSTALEMLTVAAIAVSACAMAAHFAPSGAPQSVLAALINHL